MLVLHGRRIEQRPHRIKKFCAQRWIGHLAIVAADIVQNSSVCRFDQIREDPRVNIFAVTAIARRVFAGFAVGLLVGLFGGSLHAATFTVNSTTDAIDANIGNGVCATASGVCA